MSTLSEEYPGLEVASAPSGWVLIIPDEYRVGHEAHFAQVTEQYFRYPRVFPAPSCGGATRPRPEET